MCPQRLRDMRRSASAYILSLCEVHSLLNSNQSIASMRGECSQAELP